MASSKQNELTRDDANEATNPGPIRMSEDRDEGLLQKIRLDIEDRKQSEGT